MLAVLIVIGISWALGFVCGYVMRAAISYRRRTRARTLRLSVTSSDHPPSADAPPLQPLKNGSTQRTHQN
jgi:hypothetical protein